ncbi:ABC transporter substrate-binding protein [Christiangramia salexigens]|uniref:Cobalamin-binding protein n=1 Tax=Christiangramia salexigens TaxID=1913577 RepID=A0A1L3J4Z0_9FLAO|nr:helical backbone metal receptor [Christiangramia salexigens]APG60172.1 cobalamin-binding protein [Christiangramia salexigens]
MEIRDHLDRNIKLNKIPERIISLVPSQTELLVDLGLEDQIVGITHFCVHPSHLKKTKKRVGGTKKVNLKKIKELDPDIILCNKEENTREMVEELEKIAPVHISDVVEFEDVYELISDYGKIFDKQSLAETINSSLKKKEKSLKDLQSTDQKKKVAYFIWNDPLMVAGTDTFIDSMLRLNNLDNAFIKSRYPVTSLEELADMEIDLCMLSSEPYPFKEEHKDMFAEVAREVEIVNGEYFSWYGTRLLEALDYFKELN